MNNLLDSIDEFLASQKEQEQKMFFFLPILLFGFISYYLVYPITDSDLNKAVKKEKSLKKNISSTKTKNRNLKIGNIRAKQNIKLYEGLIKKLYVKKDEVNLLVNQLSFLRFNLVEWANFYDEIPRLTMKHNLYIEYLDNEMFLSDSDKLVQEKMNIKILVDGSFIDFVKFLNEFETKKELIKIRSIHIVKKQMIVIIDIYGAKL